MSGISFKHLGNPMTVPSYREELISQIPALFISITSGIIVTRSTKGNHANLGSEIFAQLVSQPKGLVLSGLMLCTFAMVPGFPKVQFVGLGLVIFLIGYTCMKRNRGADRRHEEETVDPLERVLGTLTPRLQKAKKDGDFAPTIPLQIDLDRGIKHVIDPMAFNRELIQIRRILYLELGLPLPGIHLNLNPSAASGRYTLLVHEIPVARGTLKPGHFFVTESASNLSVMGIEHTTGEQFLPNHATIWVPYSQRKKLDAAEIGYLPPTRVLAYHISTVLRQHAHEFIGLQEVKSLLEKMSEDFPDVVEELQKTLSVPQITDVLQRLVQEDISIRNLKAIFQCIIEHGQKEKDIVMLTEYVRIGLKRYISYRYSGGQNILAAFMLDQELEEVIRKAVRKNSGISYLVLGPSKTKPILDVIKQNIGDSIFQSIPPVLLTSMDIRRYVKKLVETEIRTLPVLSYQELTSEIAIQPLGRICLH